MLYLSNLFLNEHMIRCFANSVETVLHLVVFYYFINIKGDRLNKDLGLVAFLLTIALGIRNTSIIGWIPLLLLKMIKEKAINAFL